MSESIGDLVAVLLGLTVLGLLPGWLLGRERGHRRVSQRRTKGRGADISSPIVPVGFPDRQSVRLPVARTAPDTVAFPRHGTREL